MNQDFYTMSREPDHQFPNSVFQQLIANSNSEGTGFLGNSVPGDLRVTGLNEMVFSDENEGIEASHILQSLSAAEDHRTLRRSNG
jgi:hypothetical protein